MSPVLPIHIDDMRKAAAAGKAVVIAGTGVSVALSDRAPTANWAGLLEHGAKRCGIDFNPKETDAAKLIAAADTIRAAFAKEGDYRRWLLDSVGALQLKKRALADALCGLGGIVATTNYDGLIEAASGRDPVAWTNHAKVARVLHGDSSAVLHLHGYWDEPESVVFDSASYQKVIGDEHTQDALKAMLMAKTVIFVGYGSGLDDPNFGRLVKWIERVMKASEYSPFRLVLEKDVAGAAGPVKAVSYGPHYGDLPGFLESLAPPRHRKEATTKPAYFFGRDRELREVVEHVCASGGPKPDPALVIGGPGMGKTTLTLAVLHHNEVKQRFGDRGRVFVRCEACQGREQVVRAMALTLDVPLAGNLEAAVLNGLAERGSVLLVLDNLETPLHGERAPVSGWLAELAGVEGVVLLASLRGAQRPLTVRWREPWEMAKLDPAAARDAFLAMAGEGFANDRDLEWLLRDAAGYIAYAIALLAAEAQGQPSLAALRRRWQKQGTSIVDPLERSLDFSITSPAMTPAAHRLMRLLAMLPDGVDVERDLAALFADGEDGEGAAAKLRALRLAYDEGPRLRLLPPLRVYVARAFPPEDADRRRLLSHYLELSAAEGSCARAA